MKKLLYFAAAIFLAVGCSGNGEAVKELRDSIRRADSIRAEDSIAEARALALEAARMDSLRQDSIEKVEKAIAAIPTFHDLYSPGKREAMLKKRGFKIKKRKEFIEPWGDREFITATLNPAPGISCKYVEEETCSKFTLKGLPELLDQFYADAKAYIARKKKEWPDDHWVQDWSAVKKGDTVEVSMFGD